MKAVTVEPKRAGSACLGIAVGVWGTDVEIVEGIRNGAS